MKEVDFNKRVPYAWGLSSLPRAGKFLAIAGMDRPSFNNLAEAYKS